jgi:hypothetical protein
VKAALLACSAWGCCLSLAAVEFTVGSVGGSPIPIGAGPRALGMGGAFSAVADDVTAATWNPAGMAQLERPELGLSGGYYRIDSTADGVGSDRDEWRLDHVGGVLPFYAGGFQHAVGLAWQRQYDLTASVAFGFQELIPGVTPLAVDSQTRLDRDGSHAALDLGYALAATDTLNLGAAIKCWHHDLTGASSSRSDYRSVTRWQAGSTLTTDTTRVQSESVVDSGMSVVLGGQWRALPQLSLSLVYKPAFTLRSDQVVHRTEGQEIVDTTSGTVLGSSRDRTRERQTIETQYPTSVTAGVAWRPADHQTLALDLTWTEWSEFSTERNQQRASAFSALLAPEDVADDIALRVGYEHLFLLPRWVLAARCGLLYERLPGMEPVDSLSDPGQISARTEHWYGLTTGLTVVRRRVTYDLAAQFRVGDDVGAGVHAAPDATADVRTLILRGGLSWLF